MPILRFSASKARWRAKSFAAVLRPHARRWLPLTCLGVLLVTTVLWLRGSSISNSASHSRSFRHSTPDVSDPSAPFISWPLARVCQETSWMPGLIFSCDNNSGDVGNIRNYIVTCIRYAISAGATGLLLPQVEAVSSDTPDEELEDESKEPFSYFFDEKHFRASLSQACPQITIFKTVEDITGLTESRKIDLTPQDLGNRGGGDRLGLNHHTDVFGFELRQLLRSRAQSYFLSPISLASPQLVTLNKDVEWEYPVYKDGPEFVNTFGSLLRFREDALKLGRMITRRMGQFAIEAHDGGKERFMGLHMQPRSDALSAWYADDMLDSVYLREASRHGFHAAYVAASNKTDAARLMRTFSRSGIRVATKDELLKDRPEELKRLRALTWDQQALVDFVVFVYSEYFVGVSPSSFSLTVALKRHTKSEGLYTRPWTIGGDGDGLSSLMGEYGSYWDDRLFMYEALWP